MNSSPFPSNATLFFQQGTGSITTNPLTGNPEIVTADLIIKAHLRRDTWFDKSGIERLPGIPGTSIYMRGRFTEPMQPSALIYKNEQNPIRAQINELMGRFWILPTIPSGWQEVNEAAGVSVQGWFQPDQGI